MLTDGYAAHLHQLHAGYARSAVGNARLFIRKGCINAPIVVEATKKALKRLSSNTIANPAGSSNTSDVVRPIDAVISVGEGGNTRVQNSYLDYSASRARGTSPRPKISLHDVPK